MDEQRRAFKRCFAPTLLAFRVEAEFESQGAIAKAMSERGAATSEATYRRWEAMEEPHMPDAWQLNVLCELLGREADDLVKPEELTPRERELYRRVNRGRRRGQRQADADA